MSALEKNKTILERVVSAKIAGNTRNTRFNEGEHLLRENGFTEILATEGSLSAITGAAPHDGADSFVLIEYPASDRPMGSSFMVYWINRGTKRILDSGRIQFKLGSTEYTCAGDTIPIWEIHTAPASKEQITRASLFEDGKLTIKDDKFMPAQDLPPVSGANSYSMAGRVEPIVRIQERNPLFVQFIKDYGDGDFRVSSVAKTVANYIAFKNGMTVSAFAKKFKETNEGIFQQLMSVKNLHPDLIPALDVTVAEEREGKERLSLNVAAHVAKLPQSEQLRAWQQAKNLPTHEKRFACIKKIRKSFELNGTF